MSFTIFRDHAQRGIGYKCNSCNFELILDRDTSFKSESELMRMLEHDCIEVNGVVYKRDDKMEESAMQPQERKKLEAGWYEKGRKAGREELQDELRELLGLNNLEGD